MGVEGRTGGQRSEAVLRHVMDVLVDTSAYSADPAEAGVGSLMPIDAGRLRLCGIVNL